MNSDIIQIISEFSFDILEQGSKIIFNSFEEIFVHFLNVIGNLKRDVPQLKGKQFIGYLLQQVQRVIQSKFLLCEVLFILYECLLEVIHDVSQVVISSEEKM